MNATNEIYKNEKLLIKIIVNQFKSNSKLSNV